MRTRDASTPRAWPRFALAILMAAAGAGLLHVAHAAGGALAQPARPAASATEDGPSWASLSASQQGALQPLANDWSTIGASHKLKWIDVANRMPRMQAAERTRIQARMADWAKLSPQQRTLARMRFQEAKQVAPRSREEQWAAYQALPPEQRNQLAARGTPASAAASAPRAATATAATSKPDSSKTAGRAENRPRTEAKPRAVAPSVVQARPGATTNLMSKRATPPPYQQTGLPKIAATPSFVDGTTLLPKRGPQGAATQAAAASSPIAAP